MSVRNRVRTSLGAVILITLAVACGSDEKAASEGTDLAPTSSIVASTTTQAPQTSPPATEPPATQAPTTEPPTSTVPPTTEAPTVGWTVVDPATLAAPLAFPCCASNYFGIDPSPPLPADGAPLADGIYSLDFDWPTDLTQPITATVRRFESCAVLPEGSCEDSTSETDFGVEPGDGAPVTLRLDSGLGVVLGGFTGDSDAFRAGNGETLAEFLTALEADYAAAIVDPAAQGATVDEIVAGLTASPAHGFSAPAQEGAGLLVYTHGDAPPLLFQGLASAPDAGVREHGSDIIGRISIEIVGGQPTIYLYAGFYS